MEIKLSDKIFETFEKLGYDTNGLSIFPENLTFKDLIKSLDDFFNYVGEIMSDSSLYLLLDILSDILNIDRGLIRSIVIYKAIGDDGDWLFEQVANAVFRYERDLKINGLLNM